MVVISRVRLFVHDELEALLDWHLTDLVRYIGRHSLTSLTLFFVEDVIGLGTWIQRQKAKTLSLDP